MFCANCGTKIEEGIKFCPSCGKAVSGVSNEPVAPIVQQQPAVMQVQPLMADEKYCSTCGSVIKKIAEICPKCGVKQSANTDSVAGNTGRNTLVLIASIVGLALVCAILIVNVITSLTGEGFKGDPILAIPGILLFTSPVVLSFLGWKMNNRIMVLLAGIIFFLTMIGITSGILCLVAFSKMKKSV